MAHGMRAFKPTVPPLIPFYGEAEYTGWKDEQLSWKTTCALGDWSFLPKMRVRGADALKFFSDTCVNSFANFAVDQAKHIIQCNEDGKVITEGVLFRKGEDEFEFQAGRLLWSAYLLSTRPYRAEYEWVTGFNYQVAGPNALALLEKLTTTSLRDVKFMFTRALQMDGEAAPAGVKDVFAVRMGMSGEIGFELQGPMEHAEAVLQAVLEAGKEFGLRRIGSRTIMLNHTEACFPTGRLHYVGAVEDERFADYKKFLVENAIKGSASNQRFSTTVTVRGSFDSDDIRDYYRSPIEMGWANRVKFDHEFIGRAALEREVKEPRRSVVTLEFNSEDVIDIYASLFRDGPSYDLLEIPHPIHQSGWVDKVQSSGKLVGASCFPAYSHTFRKVLSLGFVDVALATPGTDVEIVWGEPGSPQKFVRAKVAAAPYKPERAKVDLTSA